MKWQKPELKFIGNVTSGDNKSPYQTPKEPCNNGNWNVGIKGCSNGNNNVGISGCNNGNNNTNYY